LHDSYVDDATDLIVPNNCISCLCCLQTSRSIKIPKDHHRFILGPKGKRLSELELLTATKISIPRQEDSSDLITVTGTRDGIEKVAHEIQLISDEQVGQFSFYILV